MSSPSVADSSNLGTSAVIWWRSNLTEPLALDLAGREDFPVSWEAVTRPANFPSRSTTARADSRVCSRTASPCSTVSSMPSNTAHGIMTSRASVVEKSLPPAAVLFQDSTSFSQVCCVRTKLRPEAFAKARTCPAISSVFSADKLRLSSTTPLLPVKHTFDSPRACSRWAMEAKKSCDHSAACSSVALGSRIANRSLPKEAASSPD